MEETISNALYDVIVIGGGPSGMMAAATAASCGAKVVLLEKNDGLGKKLLITGGGRCNVTNAEKETRKLLERYKDGGKFLHSAFALYDVEKTLAFFHGRNMPTKEENEKRVFPTSNKAESVWQVLVDYLKETKVTVIPRQKVASVRENGHGSFHYFEVATTKTTWKGRTVIVATGGTSHPETGSTGDAYAWLRALGHTVKDPEPSLVPLTVHDAWAKKLAGTTLFGVTLTPYQNNVKQRVQRVTSKKGEDKLLFTHVGVSGPTILNMSKDVSELLKYGEVIITIDLLPKLHEELLHLELIRLFSENDKKKSKNSLGDLIAPSLTEIVFELAGIDTEKNANSITKEERVRLVKTLKALPLSVSGLLDEGKAIITSGGVALTEIDFKTMESKKVPGLYIIGDMLDIDRPSGGYSLQLCWTTGYVAGKSSVQ